MDTNASSPKHSHLLAAAVSIGATICAATAGAAYAQPVQRTETVGIADLDLSTADGARMFLKRLEKGRFVWPSAKEGKVALTPAQLSMLLEGIDWRAPQRTWRPLAAG